MKNRFTRLRLRCDSRNRNDPLNCRLTRNLTSNLIRKLIRNLTRNLTRKLIRNLIRNLTRNLTRKCPPRCDRDLRTRCNVQAPLCHVRHSGMTGFKLLRTKKACHPRRELVALIAVRTPLLRLIKLC
jgi:hypothetical protein